MRGLRFRALGIVEIFRARRNVVGKRVGTRQLEAEPGRSELCVRRRGGSVRRLGVAYFGVLIIRILLFRVLY